MSDMTWEQFSREAKLIIALIPAVGTVVLVYASLEVVKRDVADMRGDFAEFKAEYKVDMREIRSELQDIRRGKPMP
jgi:hypothetical protein